MLRFLRPNIPEHLSDEQLLADYLGGNSRALGLLYERYMPMVYGVCLKILKDSGKSEDAVMGIYESLTKKVKEHEIGAFRGWLYVLARNYCLMEWRKNQRRPTDHTMPWSKLLNMNCQGKPPRWSDAWQNLLINNGHVCNGFTMKINPIRKSLKYWQKTWVKCALIFKTGNAT
jgi:hypothetical protein